MKPKKTEFDIIAQLKKQTSGKTNIFKGIGDDCAVIKNNKTFQLLTIDNFVEDVHFDLSFGTDYKYIAYKAISRAISDIAAMGGTPLYLLVSLALPKITTKSVIKTVIKNITKTANIYKTELIGGDITNSKQLALTITVIGETDTAPVLRSTAQDGDDIYVTGTLGAARGGLELLKSKTPIKNKYQRLLIRAYKQPSARIDIGRILRTEKIASSMIDISDGFLGDLNHIIKESRKGAIVYSNQLPVHPALNHCFTEKTALEFALNGGDDYELIFTAKKHFLNRIKEISETLNIPIFNVGKIIKKGFWIYDGKKKAIATSHSYEHVFFS